MDEQDLQTTAGGVLSPCVRNCCLDEQNVCMGCFRTLKEICAWHDAPDAEKLAILLRSRERYCTRFAAASPETDSSTSSSDGRPRSSRR